MKERMNRSTLGAMEYFFEILKTSGTKIVCYGCSPGVSSIPDILSRFGMKVDYFADTYKHGVEFHGYQVLSPSKLAALDKRESLSILNTTCAWGKEIYEGLKKLGIRGRIFTLPVCFFDFDSGTLPLITAEETDRFREDMAAVRTRLMDDPSRQVLDMFEDARLTCTPEGYIRALEITEKFSGNQQYLPEELREWLTAKPLSIADCGAYTGDTIEEMAEWGISFAESWCFEPDAENFTGLKARIDRLELQDKVHVVKSGVFSKTRTLCFNGTGLPSNRISESESGEPVAVVSLDEYLAEKHVDFIKMDIEGAEMDALVGAACTIE